MTENDLGDETLFFLDRLKLDVAADGTAIRRAYARELKLIDQEHQAGEFQMLRQCYEFAMDWAAHQAQYATRDVETGQATAPPVAMHTPVNALNREQRRAEAEQLADAVFERFNESRERLVKPDSLYDLTPWIAEISLRLQDDELMNITARTLFEARIIELLASGWERGHETLFFAALSTMDCIDDRRRLLDLGHAGRFVDQAVDELGMFNHQSELDLAYHRGILDRLRREDAPDAAQLKRDYGDFKKMLQQFPCMMAIRVDHAKIQEWHEGYAVLKSANGGADFEGRATRDLVTSEASAGWMVAKGIWFVFVLLMWLSKCTF